MSLRLQLSTVWWKGLPHPDPTAPAAHRFHPAAEGSGLWCDLCDQDSQEELPESGRCRDSDIPTSPLFYPVWYRRWIPQGYPRKAWVYAFGVSSGPAILSLFPGIQFSRAQGSALLLVAKLGNCSQCWDAQGPQSVPAPQGRGPALAVPWVSVNALVCLNFLV